MRWVVIAVVLLLVCGGVFTLGGYAAFESWRVGQLGTVEAPAAVEPAATEAVAELGADAACADGAARFEARDYEAATPLLDLCLDARPDDVDARLRRGRAWAALGRHERADVDLSRALALRPAAVEGWEALVYSRAQNGDDRGAVTAAERWLEHDPGAARAIAMRADSRYRLGEIDGAIEDAARACGLGDAEGCRLESRMKDARKRR